MPSPTANADAEPDDLARSQAELRRVMGELGLFDERRPAPDPDAEDPELDRLRVRLERYLVREEGAEFSGHPWAPGAYVVEREVMLTETGKAQAWSSTVCITRVGADLVLRLDALSRYGFDSGAGWDPHAAALDAALHEMSVRLPFGRYVRDFDSAGFRASTLTRPTRLAADASALLGAAHETLRTTAHALDDLTVVEPGGSGMW